MKPVESKDLTERFCLLLDIQEEYIKIAIRAAAIIDKLDISKINQKVDTVYETILTFCKNYEELCQKKYPDAPLPLEVLKSINYSPADLVSILK